MKRWILRTFFKREISAVCRAFWAYEREVNKTSIHLKTKRKLERLSSKANRAIIENF